MTVRLRALQSFVGLEGRILRGRVFSTRESRAEYLIGAGLAERAPEAGVPVARPAVGPSEANVIPPPAETGAPRHVGGGWYEWNGARYRGREAAEAAKGS